MTIHRVKLSAHSTNSKYLKLLTTDDMSNADIDGGVRFNNPYESRDEAYKVACDLTAELVEATSGWATRVVGTPQGTIWVIFKGGSSFCSVYIETLDNDIKSYANPGLESPTIWPCNNQTTDL